MDVDFNKLKSFLAVVRYAGVTNAASKLHRTQSAVSQAVLQLEEQLGIKLITWEGKRLQLTREGKLVYNAAKRHIEALDEEINAIQTSHQEVGGSLEIGMLNDHSTNVQKLLFAKIAHFRDEHPAVSFNIHFLRSFEIEEALLRRDLDIGFLINFQSPHRFHTVEVATEQHLIVTSPSYIKRTGPLKSIRDVASKELIDIDSHFTCFTPWISYHDEASLALLETKKPAISVPNFLLIRDLVLEGQGIGVLPQYLIEEDLKRKTLVQVLPKLLPLRVWVNGAKERGIKPRLCEELFLESVKSPLRYNL